MKTKKKQPAGPKFGVRHCAWCQQPFDAKRPWAKFCKKTCRARHFDAYHPRQKDVAAGRRAVAERILELTADE